MSALILVNCTKCEALNTYSMDSLSVDCSECDICGTHIHIEINEKCETCGEYFTKIIREQ